MKKFIFTGIVLVGAAVLFSCSNAGENKGNNKKAGDHMIVQQADGTISLKVDNAECYHDMANPSSNTAEWHVLVSKSGRFNVWLSSATKDTTDLKYQNKVMLSILDKRLEVSPGCDKIIRNASDVSYPYFRADSFVGSLYLQDTGTYNIQVISEKILPKDYNNTGSSSEDNTKLLSVFFTPTTR